MIGSSKKSSTLYVIDFGLAKRFINPKHGDHISYKDGKSIIGTVLYVSIHTHNGVEQSRRDDLESTGYVLMYLLQGKLPWQGVKAKHKNEKYNKIRDMKIEGLQGSLCEGYPEEFQSYFDHVHNLEFDERPDYDYLKK